MLEQIEPRHGTHLSQADEIVSLNPPRVDARDERAHVGRGEQDHSSLDLGLSALAPDAPPPPRRQWERRLLGAVVLADALAVLLASLVAWALRNQTGGSSITVGSTEVPYLVLAILAVPAWLSFLAVGGAYDRSLLGDGAVEYCKVASMAAGLLTVVCAVSFLVHIDAVPWPHRRVLPRPGRVRRPRPLRRAQVAAPTARCAAKPCAESWSWAMPARWPTSTPTSAGLSHAGYQVVGAYLPGGARTIALTATPSSRPCGEPDQLVADLDAMEIDAIAVTGHGLFQSESLRSLAWRLHGTGIQLLMAPDLVDIAGPRIVSRPGRRPAHAARRGAPHRRPGAASSSRSPSGCWRWSS